jgi:hypothetical protein
MLMVPAFRVFLGAFVLGGTVMGLRRGGHREWGDD